VAECGAGSAGEDRGEPSAFGFEDRVTYRVHAAVEAVKAAGAHVVGDSAVIEAEVLQLRTCDNAVLPPGEVGDSPLEGRCDAFWPHSDH
jgi:hypothetical protein